MDRFTFVFYAAAAILIFTTFPLTADARVCLNVKLVQYSNPSGRKMSGECCDVGCNYCDFMFHIKLYVSFGGRRSSAWIERPWTGEFRNQNIVNFGHDINGVGNPIRECFDQLPDQFTLYVDVEDKDLKYHDKVENLSWTSGQLTQSNSGIASIHGHRGRLDFEFAAY